MQKEKNDDGKNYKSLLLMIILSFIAMYIIMYSMVDVFSHVYLNINKFYMTALMTLPMVIIEIFIMKEMYKDKTKNILIIFLSSVLMVGFFLFIRNQTAVNDKEFLRSMIPHHSSAILMCEQASIKDQEILDLCEEIVQAQKEEIDQMEMILERL